jgi:hypothetical protein
MCYNMPMRTLIIGDVHHHINETEEVIRRLHPDKVVFVGDYFDDFGDGRKKSRFTANWLKDSLKKPDRIHLFGNHDLAYFRPRFSCSGWDERKHSVINSILTKEDWMQLKFHTWVDSFLVTHAGLTNDVVALPDDIEEVKSFLTIQDQSAFECLESLEGNLPRHWYFNIGSARARKGFDLHPGILWCDFKWEFSATNFNQIFGHSPSFRIRVKKGYNSINYCVNSMGQYFLVINDGEPEIYRNEKKEMVKQTGETGDAYEDIH